MNLNKAIVTGVISVPVKDVPGNVERAYKYFTKKYSGETEVVLNFEVVGNQIIFPRNLQKFRRYLNNPFEYKVVSPQISTKISYADWFSPYSYQQEVIDEIVKYFQSDINVLFQAPTRFGKTASALGVVKELNVKTLVLVDKTLLVDQFISDWLSYTNDTLNISKLSDNIDTDVVIGTFQYLNANQKLLEELKDAFGLLIVDELHVSAANTYKKSIQSFNTRYRLGMTATPSRTNDGLTEVLYDLFGEIKVKGRNPDDMKVYWKSVKLPKQYTPSTYSPQKSYEKFFLQTEVQEVILRLLLENRNKTVMLATNSQKIQNHYMDLLSTFGMKTCVFNSEPRNKKKQDENLQLVADGQIRAFSGLNVLLKGVSIPRLEVIINLMSVGSIENLTQLIGRLKTKHEDKNKPLFINIKSKFGDYKSDKIEEFLFGMQNVERVN